MRHAMALTLAAGLLFAGCDRYGPYMDGSTEKDSRPPNEDAQPNPEKDTAPPTCDSVTVSFDGEVATVAGTPLGLDDSARTSPVSGSFSYLPCIADSRPDRPDRGEYDHGAGGAFSLAVSGHTVTGSNHPMVIIENYDPDTFRFRDGPQLLDKDKTWRRMSLDGTPDIELKVSIAITDGTGAAFQTDALPESFPLLDIGSYPHTFSIEDGGGTLLLQLSSMTQQ